MGNTNSSSWDDDWDDDDNWDDDYWYDDYYYDDWNDDDSVQPATNSTMAFHLAPILFLVATVVCCLLSCGIIQRDKQEFVSRCLQGMERWPAQSELLGVHQPRDGVHGKSSR